MHSQRLHVAVAAAGLVAILLGVLLPPASAFHFGAPLLTPAAAGAGARVAAGVEMGHRHHRRRPRAFPMCMAAGEDDSATTAATGRQQQQQRGHSRRGALGTLLGPLAMTLGAGPAMAAAMSGDGVDGAAAAAAAAMAGSSAHKSPKELQFELMKLGLDLTHAFKYEEAVAVYSEVIELMGSPLTLSEREKGLLAKAYSNRGNARFNLNRLNEAVVDYSRAIELSPDDFEYWTNRGLAFEALAESMLAEGNERDACQFYETAMISYDHAIILNPENHRLYSTAGDVLTHLGRTAGALEYYRQALMLNPASPALNGKVALLEIENGNIERGTYLLESVVHRHPEFSEMVLAAASVDWTLGRFVEGIDKYSVAIEQDPRLMDDKYLERERHWPPTMMKMVGKLREAGATDGLRSTSVSWFETRGTLI